MIHTASSDSFEEAECQDCMTTVFLFCLYEYYSSNHLLNFIFSHSLSTVNAVAMNSITHAYTLRCDGHIFSC